MAARRIHAEPEVTAEVIAWLRGAWAGATSIPAAAYFLSCGDLAPYWHAHRAELLALWRADPARFAMQAAEIEHAGLEPWRSILPPEARP